MKFVGVMAFDMGYRHFAWTKSRVLIEMNNEPMLVVDAMDCHDFCTSQLAQVYQQLLEYLNRIDMTQVDVVLVEQQMNRMNIKATKLSVFVLAYYMIRHPTIKVVEFPSFHKTKMFDAPSISKKERKEFCITYTKTHFLDTDPVALDWLEQFSKQDDICDCLMMTAAYMKKQHKERKM